jgi:hypothetical protein
MKLLSFWFNSRFAANKEAVCLHACTVFLCPGKSWDDCLKRNKSKKWEKSRKRSPWLFSYQINEVVVAKSEPTWFLFSSTLIISIQNNKWSWPQKQAISRWYLLTSEDWGDGNQRVAVLTLAWCKSSVIWFLGRSVDQVREFPIPYFDYDQ